MEGFRASATNFFRINTPLVFGVEFDSVSMVSLVQCASARSALEKAHKLIDEKKVEEALDDIARPFVELVDDYENRKRTQFGVSPFFFGRSLTFQTSFFMGLRGQGFREIGEFVDRVRDSIQAIQEALKLLSLGLDYRRYAKFRLLTPHVTKMAGGDYHIQRLDGDKAPSVEDCRFSYDFVVDSAMRLQEFDFSLERTPRAIPG
jgi:hypothetical protein